MRFFKSFRLLHRRTKSEGDIITVLAAQSAAQTAGGTFPVQHPSHQGPLDVTYGNDPLFIDAVNFTPPKHAPPFFDPADLYAPFPYATPPRLLGPSADPGIIGLEAELATLRRDNRSLKADLVEITKEATDARTALYAEMTKNAYLKSQAMIDSERLQTFTVAFTRYKAIDGLLARIGLHKAVLEEALAALESGGNAKNVVMDAIKRERAKADCTSSETTIIGPRTPEQYAAVLNMTLRVRKELKGHKKLTKFWKRAAQQDDKHKDIITPSPSAISSIYEPLSAERQKAVNDVAARRREVLAHNFKASRSISTVEDATILPVSQLTAVKGDNSDVPPASMSTASNISSAAYASDVFTTLPPLASESIKRELAQHSTSKRFSVQRGSVLRQIDLNIHKNSTIPALAFRTQIPERRQTAPASSLAHRRYSSSSTSGINFGRISKRNHKSDTSTSSRSLGSVLSASQGKSDSNSSRIAEESSKGDQESVSSGGRCGENESSIPFENIAFQSDTSNRSFVPGVMESSSDSRFLEHINEKLTPTKAFQHGASLGHISEESVIIHEQDSTFATPTTGPTTPSETPKLSKTPGSSPTRKSKLPVLKYLRRLSPLSSPIKRIPSMTGTAILKKPRTRSSSSPTPMPRTAIPISTRRRPIVLP